MKKPIVLSIIFFAAGFLTHALAFPDFLANGITDVQKIAIPDNEQSTLGVQASDEQFTKIIFDGEKFSRNNVTVGFTRYVQIINENKTQQMWLLSNTPELTTKRGYGHLEAAQKQFNERGQFVVVNKNNPKEKLVITVK
jgi:hypothetical protein